MVATVSICGTKVGDRNTIGLVHAYDEAHKSPHRSWFAHAHSEQPDAFNVWWRHSFAEGVDGCGGNSRCSPSKDLDSPFRGNVEKLVVTGPQGGGQMGARGWFTICLGYCSQG